MKAKLFYLTMAVVMVLLFMVMPTVVVGEPDPPYTYDPTSYPPSDSLELYAGGEASSFTLDIAIDWGGVTNKRAVNTSMSVKPDDYAASFIFDFDPPTFTLGIDATENVTVTVSAKEGATPGPYTYKIVADDLDNGEGPAIGEGTGCQVSIDVSADTVEVDLPPLAVVVFQDVTQDGDTTATTTETTGCGPIPSGYTVVGSFVDITTQVIYGGVVTGVRYDDSQVTNETNLRLFHCYDGQWKDVTTWVDQVNDIVYGQPTTLSPFAVGEGAGGGGGGGEVGCFIATAAYGTSTGEKLDTLRTFRDEVLLQNSLGSQLVALYYEVSPPLADFISGHEALRTLIRELLVDPVVWVVEATTALWRN